MSIALDPTEHAIPPYYGVTEGTAQRAVMLRATEGTQFMAVARESGEPTEAARLSYQICGGTAGD